MAETKIINVKVVVDGDGDINKLDKDINKVVTSSKKLETQSKSTGESTKDSLRGSQAAADRLQGGVAGVGEQLGMVAKAAKKGGAAMRSALISTGVGALIVALGLIVDNWEVIGEYLGFINKDLEKQHAFLEANLSLLDSELSLLKRQEKFNKDRGISNKENLKAQKDLLLEKRKLLGEDIKILEAQLLKEQSTAAELSNWQKLQILMGTIPDDLKLIDSEEKQRLVDLRKQINKLKEEVIITDNALDPTASSKNPSGIRKGVDAVKLEDEPTGAVDPADEELQSEIDKEVARLQAITDIRKEFKAKEDELTAIDEVAKIELDREKELAELDALEATLEQKAELNSYYDNLVLDEKEKIALKEEKITEEKLEKERKREQALAEYKVDTAANVLGALSMIAEEGSAGAKAIAVAQAILSTYQGITKALAETTDFTPTQSLRFINAAAVGVVGFANVAKILSTDVSGKAKNPNVGGGGGAKPPSFNVVGNSGVSQIAQTLNQDQDPIQAYVVAGNVTSAQEVNRNIVENATIG